MDLASEIAYEAMESYPAFWTNKKPLKKTNPIFL